ncbi:MAG: hydrogenase 3 maturation endopeptidase HyCI [Clostridiales bacterium]|nr:hydrogenase 3 maturation endopeptidase HyCI [Clostridiales bacterium]
MSLHDRTESANIPAGRTLKSPVAEALREFLDGGRLAVMGVGSVLRADDAAGMLAVQLLQKELAAFSDILLIAASTAPENFTGRIKAFRPARLLVIDAAHLGLKPGEAAVIDEAAIKGVSFSTHMLPLPIVMNYLQKETGCPALIIGIQPHSTALGEKIHPKVRRAVKELALDIAALCREKHRPPAT